MRSKLEEKVASQLELSGVVFLYEETSFPYTVPSSNHIYTPDFEIVKKDGKSMFIESKGIWDYEDRYKHLLLRQQSPDLDIRFVFQRATGKIRKGSKTTYASICKGEGRGMFRGITWKYGDSGKIPERWLTE